MSWGAVASAGIGAVGSYMGSKNSGTQSTTWSPYGPAAGPLNDTIGALGGMPYMQAYGGPYTAGLNPMLSGAWNSQYGFGQNAMGLGSQYMGQGMQGYSDTLSQMQNLGPSQFRPDQATFDFTMNNLMPGLTSQSALQGNISSRALDSNIMKLIGEAGGTGQFGSKAATQLLGNSAMANALSKEALIGGIGNMYMNAAGQGISNAMTAGGRNMSALNQNRQDLLGGFRNMGQMGFDFGRIGGGIMGSAGQGLQDYNQMYTDNLRQQYMDQQSIPIQDMINRINTYGSLGGQSTASTDNSLWGNIGAGLQGGVQGYQIYKDIFNTGDD